MSDQQTKPEQGSQRPRSYREIGKAMNEFFPGQPEAEPEEAATEEEVVEETEAPEDLEAEVVEEAEDVTEDEEEVSGDEDAEPDDEESPEEPYMVLTVNGEQKPVESREEATSLAQKGMHYTQEMQKLREEQKAWESEREQESQAVRAKEDQYATALETLNQVYGHVLGDQEPNWQSEEMQKLRQTDPNQYAEVRAQWDQVGAIRGELDRINQERQEEQRKKEQEWMQEQRDKLVATKPEWQDPNQRQKDWGLIHDYGLSVGLSDEELNNLYDHRFFQVLHDAARYNKAKTTGKQKVKATKTKTAKPGTGDKIGSQGRKLRKQREQLAKTGDVRTAGNIFQTIMEERRK